MNFSLTYETSTTQNVGITKSISIVSNEELEEADSLKNKKCHELTSECWEHFTKWRHLRIGSPLGKLIVNCGKDFTWKKNYTT